MDGCIQVGDHAPGTSYFRPPTPLWGSELGGYLFVLSTISELRLGRQHSRINQGLCRPAATFRETDFPGRILCWNPIIPPEMICSGPSGDPSQSTTELGSSLGECWLQQSGLYVRSAKGNAVSFLQEGGRGAEGHPWGANQTWIFRESRLMAAILLLTALNSCGAGGSESAGRSAGAGTQRGDCRPSE